VLPGGGPRRGRIDRFDKARGLGMVIDAEGSGFEFHATAIADGSRDVEPGTDVVFVAKPGHRGRYEAAGISPVTAASSHHDPA
jgi:cold shock CspA family protein